MAVVTAAHLVAVLSQPAHTVKPAAMRRVTQAAAAATNIMGAVSAAALANITVT